MWRRQWHPTPALLPGKSHGWRSLVGRSSWAAVYGVSQSRTRLKRLSSSSSSSIGIMKFKLAALERLCKGESLKQVSVGRQHERSPRARVADERKNWKGPAFNLLCKSL